VTALLPGESVLIARIYRDREVGPSEFLELPPLTVHHPGAGRTRKHPGDARRSQYSAPRPDLVIYVAQCPLRHEENRPRDRLVLFVTCPALNIENRQVSLDLSSADVAALRQAVARRATLARRIPLGDDEAALRSFGMALFDLLAPEGDKAGATLRAILYDLADPNAGFSRLPTCLIISDGKVGLPWRWWCPTDVS